MVWRTRPEVAMKAANVFNWPRNARRHSFTSYSLVRFKNA
jgi:hypothetical protein